MCEIESGIPSASRLCQSHPAEGPLIHEAQLRPVVGEVEPRMQVTLVGGVGRLDKQLPTHPQVQQQRAAVTGGARKDQPEVLPAAAGIDDLGMPHPRGEVVGAGGVAAGDPGAGQLDVRHRPADDVGRQALANHLDLGQFRHKA